MLKNLNPRERILAAIIACSLPIAAILWGTTSFSRTYFARQNEIRTLRENVENEKSRRLNAEMALQRRGYYREHSLPTDLNQAKIQYDSWLTDIIQKRAQMQLDSVTQGAATNHVRYLARNRPVDVFDEITFKVRAQGTIGQVVTLLTAFYELDMMHRISGLTLTPNTTKSGSSGAEILTGQLKAEFDINVISLVDADNESDFVGSLATTGRKWDDIVSPILVRNIFGPANNTPTISQSSRGFETGDPISISLSADDADEQDQLKIELVSSAIEGGKLEQDGTERRATLNFPAQAEGRYEARVRVTDNGFPPKSTERMISFNVDPPRVAPVVQERPKPKFKHAQAAVIRAVVKDKSGDDVCWIEVETIGKSFELKVGESFELDDRTWTVYAIAPRQVTLQVDDKLLTYHLGGRLDSPLSETRANPVLGSID